jgi:hypothetical protein
VRPYQDKLKNVLVVLEGIATEQGLPPGIPNDLVDVLKYVLRFQAELKGFDEDKLVEKMGSELAKIQTDLSNILAFCESQSLSEEIMLFCIAFEA